MWWTKVSKQPKYNRRVSHTIQGRPKKMFSVCKGVEGKIGKSMITRKGAPNLKFQRSNNDLRLIV